MTKASPETPIPAASGMPTRLYTHCGIKELRVEDTFFIAETPLDDGQGNPPPGWGNPCQDGACSFLSPSKGPHLFRARVSGIGPDSVRSTVWGLRHS